MFNVLSFLVKVDVASHDKPPLPLILYIFYHVPGGPSGERSDSHGARKQLPNKQTHKPTYKRHENTQRTY